MKIGREKGENKNQPHTHKIPCRRNQDGKFRWCRVRTRFEEDMVNVGKARTCRLISMWEV